MARDRRSSDRQSRREREASADRQQQLIYLAAGGVLALVVLVIVVGLLWTRYLPPRAHVLTVEDQSYNASAVVDRGKFLITFEGQDDLLGDVASAAIDVLIFEETLRRRGPQLVGPVSSAQIDAQVQALLGFDPLESALTPIPGADDAPGDGDADSSDAGDADADDAEEEPTPTPRDELFPAPAPTPRELTESEQDEFADALALTLSMTGLGLRDFEDIAEARVVRALLNRHFDEQLGSGGEQLLLSRLAVSNPADAGEFRRRALDGESFEELVAEADAGASGAGDDFSGELGWFPRDLIPDNIAEALAGVEVGGVSEVVDRGLSFEVYYIAELEPERVWEDAARRLLVSDLVSAWQEAERELLAIQIGLSDDEEVWIIERVVSHVAAQVGGAQAVPGGQ